MDKDLKISATLLSTASINLQEKGDKIDATVGFQSELDRETLNKLLESVEQRKNGTFEITIHI